MATKKENDESVVDITGLTESANPKEAEYDLLAALLKAADFANDEDEIQPVEIKRDGVVLFEFRIRPVTDSEIKRCRKLATTYMKNPNGKKLPPIEKDYDNLKFQWAMIYTATIEEDRKRIWANKSFMEKKDILEPWESVGILLKPGERADIFSLVAEISGIGEDGEDDEEKDKNLEDYAKN